MKLVIDTESTNDLIQGLHAVSEIVAGGIDQEIIEPSDAMACIDKLLELLSRVEEEEVLSWAKEEVQVPIHGFQHETTDGDIQPNDIHKDNGDFLECLSNASQTESLSATDNTGRVHNAEIDSSPAALTATGEWRARRKPKEMTKEEWIEHRANVASPPPVSVDLLSSMFDVEPSEPHITYTELMHDLATAVTAEEISNDEVKEALAKCGAESLTSIEGNSEMIAKVYGELF